MLRAGGVNAIATEAKCLALAVEVERSSIIYFLPSHAVESGREIRLGDGGISRSGGSGRHTGNLAEGYPRSQATRSAYASILHLRPSVRLASIPRGERRAGLELEGERHAPSRSRLVKRFAADDQRSDQTVST